MKCKNCGKRIVEVVFALETRWMHQHEGAAFQDGMHQFCKVTVAEPE